MRIFPSIVSKSYFNGPIIRFSSFWEWKQKRKELVEVPNFIQTTLANQIALISCRIDPVVST